jgi:hypothetical protein
LFANWFKRPNFELFEDFEMRQDSPKALALLLAVSTLCLCTSQSVQAAGFFQENSQLDITGSVLMPSVSPVTLQFLTYGGAPAPNDTFGNYFILGGTGTFGGLGSFQSPGQNTNYNIRSITEGQSSTDPFIRLGALNTAFANSNGFGVRFVLDNPVFTTQTFSGIDFIVLEGLGRWQVWDGVNGQEVQGEVGFTTQRFQRLANNTVTYSATFTVVPEPSEALGLLVVGASGALTLLRRRRLLSASK